MDEEKKYFAVYSVTAEKRHGYTIWQTEEGTNLRCTCVVPLKYFNGDINNSDERDAYIYDNYRWSDTKYLGIVVKFIESKIIKIINNNKNNK